MALADSTRSLPTERCLSLDLLPPAPLASLTPPAPSAPPDPLTPPDDDFGDLSELTDDRRGVWTREASTAL